MKFVVLIPWWLYALVALPLFLAGGLALYVGLIVLGLFFVVRHPLFCITCGLIGLSIRYWQVTVPLLLALAIYCWKAKPKSQRRVESLKFDWSNDEPSKPAGAKDRDVI